MKMKVIIVAMVVLIGVVLLADNAAASKREPDSEINLMEVSITRYLWIKGSFFDNHLLWRGFLDSLSVASLVL